MQDQFSPISTIAALSSNTTELLTLVSSLNVKFLNVTPESGGWTILEILEHLCIIDGSILNLFKGPCQDNKRSSSLKIKKIENNFLNFEKKYKSPEITSPKGQLHTVKELTDRISTIRSNLSTDQTLNEECLGFQHPLFGHLTKLEWLWFIIIHTQRHMHQISRINSKLDVY